MFYAPASTRLVLTTEHEFIAKERNILQKKFTDPFICVQKTFWLLNFNAALVWSLNLWNFDHYSFRRVGMKSDTTSLVDVSSDSFTHPPWCNTTHPQSFSSLSVFIFLLPGYKVSIFLSSNIIMIATACLAYKEAHFLFIFKLRKFLYTLFLP